MQTDISAAVLSLACFSWTGRMAVVVRWSRKSVQLAQLALPTVWTPLSCPAVAGHQNNKALVDTDAEGGGEGQSKRGRDNPSFAQLIPPLPRPHLQNHVHHLLQYPGVQSADMCCPMATQEDEPCLP